MESKHTSPFSIPTAIVIAGAIIAIAIIWVKNPTPAARLPVDNQQVITINLAPISSADHILGNPDAPIKIVEYSDTSCPYCKTFNSIMEEIINQYGPTGSVAWIYRHFPLDRPDQNGNVLHKNANNEAQSMECVANLGGNDKFWAFEKKLYEVTPSVTGATPNGLDQTQLPIIAKEVGIDTKAFNDCLSSNKFKDAVVKEYLTGVNAGVSGTPTSFFVLNKAASKSVTDYIDNTLLKYKIPSQLLFISDDKKTILMSGALPKELIIGLIDAIQEG